MKVLVAQSCLTVIPWTVAHQAPLSMGISRKEYWSGLPCPPPGHLPNPGIEPRSSEYRLILYHLPDSQGVPCVFVSTFRIKIPREEIILVYMECTHPRHKRDGGDFYFMLLSTLQYHTMDFLADRKHLGC